MREKGTRHLRTGIFMMVLFILWTWLVQIVDVKRAGETGTEIGFAVFNSWFHELTGVHMRLYEITDWLGLVPVLVCLLFGGVGLIQLVKRKSLLKVELDIMLLGIYDGIVLMCYLVFEMIPINYRPILIEGVAEASYPSSTTLLVLTVMPTLVFQAERRLKKREDILVIRILTVAFSLFMVIGRLVSGVHWFTDIVGSVLLSMGLFYMYKAGVLLYCEEEHGVEV